MHLLEATHAGPGRVPVSVSTEMELNQSVPMKTVLLAEDNDDLRFVMECSLQTMGYRVIACADADLASTAFHVHPGVDILLTDFEMPRKTGLELARELTVLRPALPVMIVTGTVLPTATMQEIRERHWAYVSKPCYLSDLESAMQRLLTAPCLAAA